ncbi:MAG TPA: DUF3300 domain-containing protein [Gammaproteobacteria bacterium]|nr:DUF3300 domain-containing protein [Gammaproteobacteria bacterium]
MRTLASMIFIPLFSLLVAVSAVFAQEDERGFTQAELDQMLAPIALYPDTLLSHILTAATYPLEVVSAARWSRENPGLEGSRAVEAVADKNWEASIKALVAFPKVLERMNQDLDWTTRLGDAFLYQEAHVMDTVQELRQRAYKAGNLDSPGNIRVIRDREVIVVEPVHPRIVYVPYYNPSVIYGAWWWPAYQPVYWAPLPGLFLGSGFYFGSGVHVSLGFFFSTFDWHRRHIVVIHRPHRLHRVPHHKLRTYVKHHGHKWRHEPIHRRGIAYRHHSLQRKHGRSRASGIPHGRRSFAGSPDRFRAARSGRDGISGSSRHVSDTGRTGDRRIAPRTRSDGFTRGHVDRARSANSSGAGSGSRSASARSGRSSAGARGFSSGNETRGSRRAEARTRSIRSPEGAVRVNRNISRGQIQSRRSEAGRAVNQRRHAAPGRRSGETRSSSRGRIQGGSVDSSRALRSRQPIHRSRSAGRSFTARIQSRLSADSSQAGRGVSRGAGISRDLSTSGRGVGSGIIGPRPRANRGFGSALRRSLRP